MNVIQSVWNLLDLNNVTVIWNLSLSKIQLVKQLIVNHSSQTIISFHQRGQRSNPASGSAAGGHLHSIGSRVRLVLDQLVSPLGLPAIAPCEAACRGGTAAWLGAEVARLSREVQSGEQSQQTTSTYCAKKQLQLWSLHVGRRGSQAVCESVWSGSLAICSHVSMCVFVYGPAHSDANITSGCPGTLAAVEFAWKTSTTNIFKFIYNWKRRIYFEFLNFFSERS